MTKQAVSYLLLLISFASHLLFFSCAKEEDVEISIEIVTTAVSDVTLTSLRTGGNIQSASDVEVSSRGIVWSQTPNPIVGNATKTADGSGTGTFESKVEGLNLKQYYIRAYAIVGDQIFYGNEVFFDHSVVVPQFSIKQIILESLSEAKFDIEIDYQWHETITERGICWALIKNPTIVNFKEEVATQSNIYSYVMDSLLTNQAYYVRAYCITQLGTFYSENSQILKLPKPVFGEVSDVEGNIYKTVVIGEKTWMAENLAVSKFNDGSAIEEMYSIATFKSTNNPARVSYEFRNETYNEYGYLYNGYVLSSSKNVCPEGWRIPSTSDWYQLGASLGGLETAGGRMKALTDDWKAPNLFASNESGFSGRPGGSFCSPCAGNSGIFADSGTDGYWWAKNSRDFFYLTTDKSELRTKNTAQVNDGLSIRCIKQ